MNTQHICKLQSIIINQQPQTYAQHKIQRTINIFEVFCIFSLTLSKGLSTFMESGYYPELCADHFQCLIVKKPHMLCVVINDIQFICAYFELYDTLLYVRSLLLLGFSFYNLFMRVQIWFLLYHCSIIFYCRIYDNAFITLLSKNIKVVSGFLLLQKPLLRTFL